jgi:hypothetical protein
MTIIGSSPSSALGKVVPHEEGWRDWPPDKLAYPYLDPATWVFDAVIQRAKSDGVDLVIVSDTPASGFRVRPSVERA